MMSHKKGPFILVSEVTSMIDTSIDISIVGLKPNQEIELCASRISFGLKPLNLSSRANFQANEKGIVELNACEPLSGTYSGIDGMGLFWSLEITGEANESQLIGTNSLPLSPQKVTLTLLIENEVVDEIEINRLWQAKKITRNPVRENGLVGTFFYEENTNPKPGIIVLGGSEGGIYEYPATLLAAHGYSVLALAYFGAEHLPKMVVNIPLEYIKKAVLHGYITENQYHIYHPKIRSKLH